MSDIAIPGFDSQSNTAKQIENLMKAKRIPLEKMEAEQEEYNNLKGVWQDLNVTLSKLSDSAKKLYGFENPFNEKRVTSSNEAILTAESERSAIDENMEFIVEKLATSDKFSSDAVDSETKVPRGTYTFTIGEKDTTLKYRGGDLDDFVTKLNKKNPELLRASLIKNSKTTQVLLLESLKTGSENRLTFKEDSEQLGLDLGMIQENNIENKKVKVNDIIKSKGLVEKNSYDMKLSPESSASFRLNTEINKNDIIEIEIELRYTPKDKENQKKKELLDDITVPSVTHENITINSSVGDILDRSEKEEVDKDKPPVLDMNVVSLSNGKFNYKLDPIINENNTKQILSFKGDELKDLNSINIINNNSEKTLIVHSVIQKKGAGDGKYVPVNPISVASDSLVNMNGMKIERSENKIDDLVDGTTLYLHSEDPDEKVNLSIDYNTDYAKEQIYNFVTNYNDSLRKILILTNDDKAILSEIEFADDKAEEKAEEIHGLLRGDRVLNRVKQNLHRVMTNAYPADEPDDFTLLKSIGISTNVKGGSGVDASKLRGYMEIDVDELDKALTNNIEGVKDLFGQDTNNDFIIDTGIAKQISDTITPYVQSGGVFTTRIRTIDTQIKDNEKEINDYKDDLISYEDQIRRKYGQMDATINQLNSSMESIENLTNTGDK